VANALIEVKGEVLKDEAGVAAVVKLLQEAHDAPLVLRVLLVQQLQQADLRARLPPEGLLVLDYLDSHLGAGARVRRGDDLWAEGER
jgi:hypothetical protein